VDIESAGFAEFYETARDDCLRAVFASVGDRQVAEDLVAEAFAITGTLRPPTAIAGSGGTGGTLDAWTVTAGPGGAIEVTVRQLENAAGLQNALRAAGIPVQVAFQAGQPSDSPPLPADCKSVTMSDEANADLQGKILGMPMPPAGGEGIALTIYPRQIPKGIGIYLAIQSGSNSRDWGWGLDLVQATPACTG
jgi:hypothetical protein